MKKSIKLISLSVFLLLAGCVTPSSTSVSKNTANLSLSRPGLKSGLDRSVMQFEKDFKQKNFTGVLSVMPKQFLDHMAKKGNVSVSDLKGALIELMKRMEDTVKIVSFDMDSSKAKIRSTSKGRVYSLVPTTTTMDIKDRGRIEVTNHTVGIYDANKWHLVRIADQKTRDVMIQIFPSLSEINIPEPTKKVLSK